MAHDRSVKEIAAALTALRVLHPVEHAHLKAYRCNAEWRQVKTKIKFRGPSGRMVESPGWKRERLVPSWVVMERVVDAENRLVYWLPDIIMIPKELWDGLTKPAKSSV
jgi:hypothetical protein